MHVDTTPAANGTIAKLIPSGTIAKSSPCRTSARTNANNSGTVTKLRLTSSQCPSANSIAEAIVAPVKGASGNHSLEQHANTPVQMRAGNITSTIVTCP